MRPRYRALNDLKGETANRLIIYLLGNFGSSLEFAYLASYRCPGQIAIGHRLTPKPNVYEAAMIPCTTREPIPRNRPELLVTLARHAFRKKSLMLLTQGLGAQPFHNRIVLLVNDRTNSAAEMVANFAAENHLVTVVGQKTHGNVLGATNFKLPGRLFAPRPHLLVVPTQEAQS